MGLTSWKNRPEIPKEAFKKYRADIDDSNRASMSVISMTGMLVSYLLLLLSLPFVGVLRLTTPYIVLSALFTLLHVLSQRLLKRHPGATMVSSYVLMVLLLGLAIIMGTFYGRTANAVTFLIFLLTIPQFIVDRVWRIQLVTGGMTALFLLLDMQIKTGEIRSLDISNTLVVYAISFMFTRVNVQRKLAQIDLRYREQEAVFKKDEFINAIPTGIGIFEIRGDRVSQTYVNDGFYRLMRDTREARKARSGENFIESIHPQDRAKVSAAIVEVIKGKSMVSVTCRAQRGDASYMWVRFTASVASRTPELTLVYTTYVSMEDEVAGREALEQSRRVLQSAMDSANMTIWEFDAVRHCIRQTSGSREKHGYGEIVANVPESLIENGYVHKSSVTAYRKMFEKLYETKRTVQGDFYVRSESRSGWWWEHIILTPRLDAEGRLSGAIGTSLDVTDRKEREEQYYKQIGMMSDGGERNLIAKAQYDLTHRKTIYYNAMRDDAVSLGDRESFETVLVKMMRVQPDEESRQHALQLFNRDRLLRDYAAGRTEGSVSYRRCVPGRPVAYANTRYLISADPQSGDVMLFIYCYDDTAHVLGRQIVDRLGSSEYDAIGIIDVGTGSYSLRHLREGFLSWIEMSGSDYYATVQEIIHRLVVPQEQEEMIAGVAMDRLKAQLQSAAIYELPYSAYDTNQELRRKKLQFRYLDEAHASILYTCSDVTEPYRAEQEQLLRTQQALVEARQATQAKTDFLSRMSHDIRTPLNAILGTAALAREETQDPAAMRESLETIDSAGHFLLGLINDILDISKIESGRIELRPEPCRVADFTASIESSIRPLMEKKHIDFVFSMACGYRVIVVDRLRHHQIFFNLLSNAAKYTPEYGRVEYRTEHIDAPEGMAGVRNIVRDNGIGMTQEYMAHIFEPFTRDSNAAINQTEGSGLGLAIVKNIVDAMGGKISIKSELGKGTEVVVDLFMPLPTDDALLPAEAKTPAGDTLSGRHILLVEDNPINTRIAERLLARKGCVVTVAGNGQEAVETFRASTPGQLDLILMDIRMPVMNGLDASRAIRAMQRPDAERIPIVAMTADAFNEDVSRTREAGMNGHLSKPVEPERLYATLNSMLA